MKLKDGVFLHNVGGEYMGVTKGAAAESFNGLIRSNKTANDIMEILLHDTTEQKIISALSAKYAADEQTLTADVHRIISQLRAAGLIDE